MVNKKIINATKTVNGRYTFHSKLESYMYELLVMAKIHFEMQRKFILVEKFKYRGETVRSMGYSCDFSDPNLNWIIDVKGYHTQQGDLRLKLLKIRLTEEGKEPVIFLPSTRTECERVINQIKEL